MLQPVAVTDKRVESDGSVGLWREGARERLDPRRVARRRPGEVEGDDGRPGANHRRRRHRGGARGPAPPRPRCGAAAPRLAGARRLGRCGERRCQGVDEERLDPRGVDAVAPGHWLDTIQIGKAARLRGNVRVVQGTLHLCISQKFHGAFVIDATPGRWRAPDSLFDLRTALHRRERVAGVAEAVAVALGCEGLGEPRWRDLCGNQPVRRVRPITLH